MNRLDFQQLSELRLNEARLLLQAGFPDGAYYLAGYAVECALKACIAKRTCEHDFPDKKLVNDSHTHDIGDLLKHARLNAEFDALTRVDPVMKSKLDTIEEWSESRRYQRNTRVDAESLLEAIEEGEGGLLPWIRQRW
jgi:HEPN domain-containing protein